MIYEYAGTLDFVKKEFIQSDIFEVHGNVDRTIDRYIPDLYYDFDNCVLLGEAKTSEDLDRQHSIQQYLSYLNKLEQKAQNYTKCYFILATPWGDSISGFRIIKRILNNRNKIHIVIINEMGVYKEYEAD